MVGIEVRVEQADRDRLHAGAAQLPHPLAHLVLVERDEDVAVRNGDPLVDGEAVAPLDERS